MKRIYLWILLLFAYVNVFAQSNMVQCEYWLDSDYASKMQTDLSPAQTVNWQTNVPCQNLDVGFHAFCARFMDSKGLWSSTVSSFFYKFPVPKGGNTMTAYEYWVDDGTRTTQAFNLATPYSFSQNIEMKSLPAGFHAIHVRFLDSKGLWSPTVSSSFYKFPVPKSNNTIVAYEYWINDDYTNKIKVKIAPQQTFVLLDSVNCSSANKVLNTLSYRFLDNSGLWSSTVTSSFYHPATISVNLTYTKSVLQGETPAVDNFYPNYADVGFTISNMTKKQDITNIAYQYPNLVLNQQVDVGDSLLITAISHSTTNGFEPVVQKIAVDNDVTIPVTFNIIQRGLIRSNYQGSENDSNVGIVYDSNGQRIAQYDYVNQTLDTDPLADGTYQLLSMANSPLYNTIQNLSAFASTPLKQNTDYILQTLTVKSGIITETTVPTIPKLDEASVLYTTDNTTFSVNKTSIAIGNYVTLRGQIEFKGDYQTQVSNVKMIVDIPEQCSFVNNSVMTGNTVFNGYSLQNNQLTVPLTNYSNVVQFCIIPTQGGVYAPNGFIEFTLNGNTIRQPIGAANFTAEGLNIVVPSLTAQNTIPVSGIATANSLVKIYDGDQLIGQTTALANGNWSTKCDLYNPYAFSLHEIHAEVTTPQGLAMQTETKEVVHDITALEVSKVTMYNTAHQSSSLDLYEYATAFDFLNPSKVSPIYWYWPNYPDFTFKIEFTNNDPNSISDVKLNVLTSSGSIVSLPTVYDDVQGAWVATSKFPNTSSLPVNIDVDYNVTNDTTVMFDMNYVNDQLNQFHADSIATQQELDTIDSLSTQLNAKIEQIKSVGFPDTLILKSYDSIFNQIDTYFKSLGKNESLNYHYLDSMSVYIDNYVQYISQFNYPSNVIDSVRNVNIENFTVDTTYINNLRNFDVNKLYLQKLQENGIDIKQDATNPNTTLINFNNQNVSILYNVSTCDNLTESSLLQQGYKQVPKTNGSFVYMKSDNNGGSSLVDFSANIHETVQINGNSNNVPWDDIKNLSEDIISNITSSVLDITGDAYKSIIDDSELYNYTLMDISGDVSAQNYTVLENSIAWNAARDGLSDDEPFEAFETLYNSEKEFNNLSSEEEWFSGISTEFNDAAKSIKPTYNSVKLAGYALQAYGYAMTIKDQYDKKIGLDDRISSLDGIQTRCGDMNALKSQMYSDIADLSLNSFYYNGAIVVGNYIGGTIVVAVSPTIVGGIIGGAILGGINFAADHYFKNYYNKKLSSIDAGIQKLGCFQCPGEPPATCSADFTKNKNATFTLDPSGYVYEAVPSNRLQGVTAGVYHKMQTEDMYGNVTENVVLWNAADYGQTNPQITNEYGEYAWDVPQDVWQVKYEKAGYTTVYSDWLPVPPPQLNINIAMVQAVPPHVAKVQGYESGIEITFDKFMQPTTMTPDFITVTRNGASVTGTITLLDAEANPANSAESFVSKVRFVPDVNFSTSDNVILTVKQTVQSYTGNEMDNDFVQQIKIQTEVKSMTATSALNIALHDKNSIEVTAAPNNAAAGKTITARCISSALATVTGNAVLDANGKATLQVTGELPGSTQVEITLDGTDLKTIVNVNIAMPTAGASQVEAPTASIPSGSTVEKNTKVILSSETEGATIYYTTDGSTPAYSTGLEYTQPIVLKKDVTIQAIAVKDNMLDSDIAVFEYKVTVTQTDIDQPNRAVSVFVKNQTLFVRGLEPGEQYAVHSVLGYVVVQGKVTNEVEQQIPLPSKGVFIFSTSKIKAKILVK